MSPKQILGLTGVGCLLASALVAILGYNVYQRAAAPVTELEFKEHALLTGLLSDAETLDRGGPHRGHMRPFFVRWYDGRNVLLRVVDTTATALNSQLEPTGEVEIPGIPENILDCVTEAGPRLVVLHGPGEVRDDLEISTVSATGETQSIHQVGELESGLERIAILQRKDDAPLVLTAPGGQTGVLAFDPQGTAVWDVPKQHVFYELRTHSRLPGLFLRIGWDAILFEDRLSEKPRKLLEWGEGLYVSQGTLACTARGEARVFAIGPASHFDHPTVMALNQKGRLLWKTRLPFKVGHVALLEPEGKNPAVILLGDVGDLVVFDLTGRLLAETRIPDADTGDPTYGLVAGALDDGSWGIVATSLKDHFFYRVDVSVLPDASNAAQEK